jgi:hypothetical protein
MTDSRTTSVGAAAVDRPNGHESTLSAQRAFVVHLSARDRQRVFSGRVEHLSSGQSTYFSSLGGMMAFFTSFIDAPRRPAPRSPAGRARGTRAPKSA